MMIRWWEHSQKGVTDGRTDGRTDWTIHGAAWSQLKTIGHLFYATSSFVHHFVAISEFKLEYSPETPNLGKVRRSLELCDLEIWLMTLKNNRAPLLCCFQLCAWFHCHMWIQTGVRVRKQLSLVLTSVTLIFDLWPWPLAWTSLLSMVIIPDNFMMIGWWVHGEKGVTDRRTDRQTDWLNQSYSCLVAAKNKRAPLPCCFKLCASFHSHQWTLTGVTVRKRPIWVKINEFF